MIIKVDGVSNRHIDTNMILLSQGSNNYMCHLKIVLECDRLLQNPEIVNGLKTEASRELENLLPDEIKPLSVLCRFLSDEQRRLLSDEDKICILSYICQGLDINNYLRRFAAGEQVEISFSDSMINSARLSEQMFRYGIYNVIINPPEVEVEQGEEKQDPAPIVKQEVAPKKEEAVTDPNKITKTNALGITWVSLDGGESWEISDEDLDALDLEDDDIETKEPVKETKPEVKEVIKPAEAVIDYSAYI